MPEAQTELVIGLVAAVGTDADLVADLIQTELTDYRYDSQVLRLSDYLAELDAVEDFRDRPYDERVWAGMDAGNLLRREWEHGDALALWAISDIVAERDARSAERVPIWPGETPTTVSGTLDRYAFILRSLKNRAEAHTLRAVYGSRFFLIAAYSPDDVRMQTLHTKIERDRKNKDQNSWAHLPRNLMDRDLDEQSEGGQDVVGTFYQADFFVDASGSNVLKGDVDRILSTIFGDPFRTPTRDEQAQFIAAGAALRSAELGRQVGAAIADDDGSILAVGANEVPQPGGGSHWEEDDSAPDNREFRHSPRDSNRIHQERIAAEIAEALGRRLGETIKGSKGAQGNLDDLHQQFIEGLDGMLLDAGLRDITEYGRAVHAEMNALLDAARRGVAIAGATLHTTTFPCHNCARHIIGAGIKRVVFVEPYEKSRAKALHDESIIVAQSEERAEGRVELVPFVGVAPRRFRELFNAAWRERNGYPPRKDKDGVVSMLDKTTARPVFADLEYPPALRPDLPAYRAREITALSDFEQFLENVTAGQAATAEAPKQSAAPADAAEAQSLTVQEGGDAGAYGLSDGSSDDDLTTDDQH